MLIVQESSMNMRCLLLIMIGAALLGVSSCSAFIAGRAAAADAPKRVRTTTPSTISSSSLPDINYGLSDEEFGAWLLDEVKDCPGRATYSTVYEHSIMAIVKWRQRYRGNPKLWKRIFKKERVIKELIESAPIIEAVKQAVEESNSNSSNISTDETQQFTIIDLCSGKGYLAMILSGIACLLQVKKRRS